MVGLYAAAAVRLIVSGDWNDPAAKKLFSLTLVAAGLLLLIGVATAGSIPAWASAGVRQKRWSIRTIVATIIVVSLFIGGPGWFIVIGDFGDPIARLLNHTVTITLVVLYLIDWLPLQRSRR
ncbi:hypothetical protein [Nocardia rhizosphaerihabitans]|uniref:hypothetical protein n=1 Tax=Nocardia rhizosphaerihabitans TaxID=1691570 RepID=UPI0016674B65|nr:hypothetical protein [Nocardia rhizosphaerihabitans]